MKAEKDPELVSKKKQKETTPCDYYYYIYLC